MWRITDGLAAYKAYKILTEKFDGSNFDRWYDFALNYAGIARQDLKLPKPGGPDYLVRSKTLMHWYIQLCTLKGFVRGDVHTQINDRTGPQILLACNSDGLSVSWPTTSPLINRAFQNAYYTELIVTGRQHRAEHMTRVAEVRRQINSLVDQRYKAERRLHDAKLRYADAQKRYETTAEKLKRVVGKGSDTSAALKAAQAEQEAANKEIRGLTYSIDALQTALYRLNGQRERRELPPIEYIVAQAATLAAERTDALIGVMKCDALFTIPKLPLEFVRGTDGVFKINFGALERVKDILRRMGIGGRSGSGQGPASIEASIAGGEFCEFIRTEMIAVLQRSQLTPAAEESELAGWGLISAYLSCETKTSLGVCNNGLAGSLWYLLYHLACGTLPGSDGLFCISTVFEENQPGHEWHLSHGFGFRK